MSELSPEAKALLSQSRKAGAPDAEDLARVRAKLLSTAESERILALTAARAERERPAAPRSRGRWVHAVAAVLAFALMGAATSVMIERQKAEAHRAGVLNWNQHLLAEARVQLEAHQWGEARKMLLEIRSTTPDLERAEVETLLAHAEAELAKQSKASGLDDALVDCRMAMSAVGPPRWAEAEAACRRAQAMDAQNAEAQDLLARIKREADCQAALEVAQAALATDQLELAWGALGRVGEACPITLVRAQEVLQIPLREAGERATRQCRLSAESGKWAEALPACEQAARVRCQALGPEVVEQSRLAARRPAKAAGPGGDAVLTAIFQARGALGVAGDWSCPEVPVLRSAGTGAGPVPSAREVLRRRFGDRALVDALMLYVEGRTGEAREALQRLPGSSERTHDLDEAVLFAEKGNFELGNDEPEKAEEPLRKALQADERLLLGPARSLPEAERARGLAEVRSKLRREAVDGMASKTYEKGKASADRKDFKQACFLWKLGMSFSRANDDLLKASYFCTQKGQKLLDHAESCGDLAQVLEYAVDGDHLREDVERRLIELHCEPHIRAHQPARAAPSGTVDPSDFVLPDASWTPERRLEAIDTSRRAVQADPTNAEAYLRLGYLYRDEKRYQDAAEAFFKYRELRPKAPNEMAVSREMVDCVKQLQRQREDEAKDPAHEAVTEVRARYRSGDLAGAASLAESCEPRSAVCRRLGAQLREYRAKTATLEALSDGELLTLSELDKAIGGGEPSEQSKSVRQRLAASLFAKAGEARLAGEWGRAAELGRRALAFSPNHAGAQAIVSEARNAAKGLYLRAYMLKDTNPDEAIKRFEEVLALTPKDDEYHQKAEFRLSELGAK